MDDPPNSRCGLTGGEQTYSDDNDACWPPWWVCGFGVQRRIFSPKVIGWAVFVALETEDTCQDGRTLGLPEGPTPLATPVTSPGHRFDARETW